MIGIVLLHRSLRIHTVVLLTKTTRKTSLLLILSICRTVALVVACPFIGRPYHRHPFVLSPSCFRCAQKILWLSRSQWIFSSSVVHLHSSSVDLYSLLSASLFQSQTLLMTLFALYHVTLRNLRGKQFLIIPKLYIEFFTFYRVTFDGRNVNVKNESCKFFTLTCFKLMTWKLFFTKTAYIYIYIFIVYWP